MSKSTKTAKTLKNSKPAQVSKELAAIRSRAAFRAHLTMAQTKAKRAKGPAKKGAAQRALEIGSRMKAFEKQNAKLLSA